jgi:hypothetical protein
VYIGPAVRSEWGKATAETERLRRRRPAVGLSAARDPVDAAALR